MLIPESLHTTLTTHFGRITTLEPCSGGDINRACRFSTPQGLFFLKWHPNSPPGMFTAESRGLELLKSTATVQVPDVLLIQEVTSQTPAFLVLTWLQAARAQADTETRLAEQMAALHRMSAAQYGLDHDNFIGILPQSNCQHPSWIAFYTEERLRPQMEIARQRGYLPPQREKNLQKLIDCLPRYLNENSPSLLHGDLWRGNMMILENGQPAVIDPAVYYGHREVEIAFMQLFGGFSERFYSAYQANFPLETGFSERRALYQLYPLLVHLNLFGGGYAQQVDAILQRYVNG